LLPLPPGSSPHIEPEASKTISKVPAASCAAAGDTGALWIKLVKAPSNAMLILLAEFFNKVILPVLCPRTVHMAATASAF
jgi:hypothetical protein